MKWGSRLPLRRRSFSRSQSTRGAASAPRSMAVVALQAELDKRRRSLRWRSSREYSCRQAVAWVFAASSLLVFCAVSLIYALKFTDLVMSGIAIAWLVAYGWTFAILEPLQVLLLVLLRHDDSTRCGRCLGRLRFVYNEICAP